MTQVRWRQWVATAGLAFGVALTSAASAWGQATGIVTGRVTDRATGRPLEGAEVGVAGTNTRVSTDAEGRYTLPRVSAGAHTIRALMIGYTRLEAQINLVPGQSQTVDFTLAPAAMQLDEVVVTGQPGRTEKRTLGNAVSKIDAANVAEAAVVADVQDLLTGRTPGLTVISNSGQAGAGSNFRIRGAGSMEAGYQPVYYIDGIRFESRLQVGFGTGNSTVQPTNPLSFLNPDDIESVEVIKGPSAATLYGADAASGVIQIITKKGRRGAGVQWTFGAETGETRWTEHIGNPINYWLCRPSNIRNPASFPGCAGMDSLAPESDRLLVHNPLREDTMLDGRPVIRDGNTYKFDLSARGGGDFFNYYLSFDRYSEDGVFWNNFDRRIGGRANIEFTPSEKLDIGVNFGYARNHSMQPLNDNASNGLLRNAFRGQAKGPVQTQGVGAPGWRGFAPDLSNSFDNQIRTERTTIGLTGNWRPFSFMQNRITLGLDKQDLRNTQFYTIDTTGLAPWGAVNATGVISHYMPTTHVWTADVASTINFDLTPDLSSSFSTGMQLNSRARRIYQASGEGLIANTLNLVGAAAVRRGDEDFVQQTSLGFYFQEQVGWRERMYLTTALRVDDNSAFGSDFSMVYYPKASLSWVVSEEEFFPIPFVEQMKLRFAWGKAGNAPQPFSADRTFTTNQTTAQSGNAEVTVSQLQPSEYGNANLKAEEGVEYETGFDASLLGGKLGLEFTYYHKSTKDALIALPDPPSSGFGGDHLENIGEVVNQGLEVLATLTPVNTRSLTWDATLSFSRNSNKLVDFGGRPEDSFGAFATVQKHKEGYPLGGFWYNDVDRDGAATPDACPRTWAAPDSIGPGGCPLINPATNNVTVDINKYNYVGPSVPTREAAFTNTITLFNNLRLFAHLDYKGGFKVWCALCSVRSRIDRNTYAINAPDRDTLEVLVHSSLQTRTWIMDGDFLKLRELSVSYTLPSSWSQAFRASRVTMTLAGRNLRRWTKYKGTGDPEVNFSATSNFTRLDYASVPPMQQFFASVRITF